MKYLACGCEEGIGRYRCFAQKNNLSRNSDMFERVGEAGGPCRCDCHDWVDGGSISVSKGICPNCGLETFTTLNKGSW